MSSVAALSGSVGRAVKGHRFRARHLFLGAAFVLAVVGAVISVVDQEAAEEIAPVGVMIGLAVAGFVIRSGASVYEGRERLAFRMIGSGFLIGATGVLTVAVVGMVAPPAPKFGPTDLIFMFAYGTMMAGFALMPQLGAVAGSRARVLLDGLVGAVSMATVMWVVFFPALEELLHSANFWEKFAGAAYPLFDTSMVVVAMIVTIRRSNTRFDARIVFLGAGMVAHALADLSYLTSGIGESFETAEPPFHLFLLATGLYLAAAAVIRRQPKLREYADRRQSLWAMLAPYGVTLMAVIVVARRLGQVKLGAGNLEGVGLSAEIVGLLGIGLLLIGLVVARQSVALREYRRLVQVQRSALVSSVSHELRTPLTALVGFLDILKDPRVFLDAKERTELTEVVHQQAVYMSRIVSDLVLLARSSSGLQLREKDVKLDKLIGDTLNSIPDSLGVLEIEVDPNLVGFLDVDRVQQVVSNLVVNAIRYGAGRVLIRAESVNADLIIEVHDNGEGVPRKFERTVWEQFERGAHRLNSTVPGSGIGLAIVDMVVRRHGGLAIYERSKRLGGACFRVSLPGRARGSVEDVAEVAASPLANRSAV